MYLQKVRKTTHLALDEKLKMRTILKVQPGNKSF